MIFFTSSQRQLRDVFVPTRNHVDKDSESAPEFCIDAGSIGNVARFINHSCEPNLFVQCVFSSHHDARFARVILFAAENIPPLQVTLFPIAISYLLICWFLKRTHTSLQYAGERIFHQN